MERLQKLHFWFGLIGIVLFLLSGQYMAHRLHVNQMADTPRMIMRAGHIYLLLASVINLLVGYYLITPGRLRFIKWLSSLLLLAAQTLLLYGFMFEASLAQLNRPVTRMALITIFIAVVMIALERLWERVQSRD
jgi:hypothetical protein